MAEWLNMASILKRPPPSFFHTTLGTRMWPSLAASFSHQSNYSWYMTSSSSLIFPPIRIQLVCRPPAASFSHQSDYIWYMASSSSVLFPPISIQWEYGLILLLQPSFSHQTDNIWYMASCLLQPPFPNIKTTFGI